MDIPLNMYRKRKQAAAALFLLRTTGKLLRHWGGGGGVIRAAAAGTGVADVRGGAARVLLHHVLRPVQSVADREDLVDVVQGQTEIEGE